MKTVRVTIFHQQYSVAAADDSGEIEELAQEVDELMVSIAQRAGNVDSARVAVLASLHLADRLSHHRARVAGTQGQGRREVQTIFPAAGQGH